MFKNKNKYIKNAFEVGYYNGIREFLDLYKNWFFIIRDPIVNNSYPIRIFYPKNFVFNGILFVNVDSFALLEFEIKKKYIKNWINIYFAKNAIKDIIVYPKIV